MPDAGSTTLRKPLRLAAWLRPSRPALWALLTFMLGFALSLEIRLTHDSYSYIDIAQSIASGRGVATYQLRASSTEVPERAPQWPPGYPFALAVALKAGASPILGARLVLALAFALSAALVYRLYQELSGGTSVLVFPLWCLCALGARIWRMAWSEPLYCALTALFLLTVLRQVRKQRLFGWALVGILAAAAALTRHIGMCCLPVAVVAPWLTLSSSTNKRPSLTRCLLATALVLSGFAVAYGPWAWRHVVVTGQLLPRGHAAALSNPLAHAAALLRASASDLSVPLTVLACALLTGHACGRAASGHLRLRPALVLLGYCATYLLVLLTTASLYHLSTLNSRFTAPLYVAAVPLILAAAHPLLEKPVARRTYTLAACALAAVVLFEGATGLHHPGGFHTRPCLASWISTNTSPHSLLIGHTVGPLRYYTGRTVLWGWAPDPLRGATVSAFIQKFRSRFTELYVVDLADSPEDSSFTEELLRELRSLGYPGVEVRREGLCRAVRLSTVPCANNPDPGQARNSAKLPVVSRPACSESLVQQ